MEAGIFHACSSFQAKFLWTFRKLVFASSMKMVKGAQQRVLIMVKLISDFFWEGILLLLDSAVEIEVCTIFQS